MNDNNTALYEVEAYKSVFKDYKEALAWLDGKRKLLEDAGLTVMQYSMHTPTKDRFEGNIQATRGSLENDEFLG